MQPIDIVYILGTGSKWKNNEIRFSLRSVEKYLSGYRDIYIVGECPSFLKNVRHIPAKDFCQGCHERNIYEKILIACNQQAISNNFLQVGDDIFFLRPMNVAEIPCWYKGDLYKYWEGKSGNPYAVTIKNTYNALSQRRLNTFHFDGHNAFLFNKDKFREIMPRYDWGIRYGYAIRSLYCNTLNIQGQPMQDCKIFGTHTVEQLKKTVQGRYNFSVGDSALTTYMEIFLKELYPEPSRWEI